LTSSTADDGSEKVVAKIDVLSNRYNKYLAVAARVVRRSLKDEQRLQAEKRGEMELRFAKWTVSLMTSPPNWVDDRIGID
jgi:hypothetical protein